VGRYKKRSLQLGIFWLAQRTGSPAWYRCWREGDGTQRISLGTSDFDEAKQRLTDWFILQVQPEKPASAVFIAEVVARYWNERGQFTSHPPTTRTHCNYWLDYFGEKSVEAAMEYAEQERFKAALVDRGLAPQTINNVLSTGRAALRMAWKKGELKSVPPFSMVQVGDQEPMGRPLVVEEGRTLLSELRDHVWLVNVLLIGTMARPSSVFQMDWEQVDFEADLIFLNKPGRRQNKKRRPVVKMPPFLKAILLPLRAEGPVITFGGKRVKSVRTAWRRGRARAKLDETVTLYSWRHTLSRYLRSQGVPKWEVEGQLGHRTGVTERYAEYAPDFQAKATAAIEQFWQLLCGDNSGTPKWEMSANYLISWCRLRGLNSRPSVYKTAALPLS
jgi:integrase